MDVVSAIKERRAVKHFDRSYVIPEATERELFELARLAPTAFNIQHCRFVKVIDPALRAKIREVAWGQAQVTDASLLIVLCADIQAWSKNTERYWRNAPKEVQDFLIPAIKGYYEGRPQLQRDECMRSCGIAAQTLMLAAKQFGLDSCPMDGFDFDKVAELIKLPKEHLISMFVVIGRAKQPAHPRGGDIPFEESVIVNTF